MRADASSACANAALDLTSAAVSTGLALTALSLDYWGRSVETFARAPARRSWPAKPTPFLFPEPAAILAWVNPLAYPESLGAPAWVGSTASVSPLRLGMAWLEMFPLRGPPAAWPLAYLMLAYGAPRSVAFPAAEANAAAIEVADAAMKPMRAFASYRSDGGHAATVLMSAAPTMIFALKAMSAATLAWPWIGMGRPALF